MNPGIGEVLNATVAMYLESAREATTALIKNWIIVPASIVLCLLFFGAVYVFGSLGLAGGFLISIVEITAISMYYRWLDEAVHKNPLKYRELVEFDAGMFFRVLNILFVLFIVHFLLIGVRQTKPELIICLDFVIIILLNAAPEIVYLHKYDGMTAIGESINFVKTNWIEWFLPFVIMSSPLIMFIPWTVFLESMAKGSLMVPGFSITRAWMNLGVWVSYIALPLAILAGNWFMLFRGFLFQELNTGSRRQRIFKARTR